MPLSPGAWRVVAIKIIHDAHHGRFEREARAIAALAHPGEAGCSKMAAWSLTKTAGDVWCRIPHESPMWPIHGEYRCRRYMRRFPVPWETGVSAESQKSKSQPVAWSAWWPHFCSLC